MSVKSPLLITMILHYWACPERYAWRELAHATSPAVREIEQQLVNAGLLRPVRDYDINDLKALRFEAVREAVQVYVEALGAIPFPVPVNKWVIPSNKNREI